MGERHSDESGLPPLTFGEPQIRVWLARRDGRPPTDAEVRAVYAGVCRAWAIRAARRRREIPEASDEAVASDVIESVLRDFGASPEVRALLTLAYALVVIASGVALASVEHAACARAQQAEWRRRRRERAALLAYLAAKLGGSRTAPHCGLPPALVCLVNCGTPAAARGWVARLEPCAGSSSAYARATEELYEHGRTVLAAYPDFARPEPGLPRGLWLTPAERGATAVVADVAGVPASPPSGGGPPPPGGVR